MLVLVIGEVIPKTLAVRFPDKWALRVAGPMFLLLRVTRPFQRFAQGLNDFLLRVVIPRVDQAGGRDERGAIIRS